MSPKPQPKNSVTADSTPEQDEAERLTWNADSVEVTSEGEGEPLINLDDFFASQKEGA